jgi:ubiquinol-cytochrome c reductase cytochrome c1 subunit
MNKLEKILLFSAEKVGDLMKVSMSPAESKAWFGKAPPDLSVEVRSRGADWIYTYLRTFYRDDSRPTGWNNLVYKNVGMPHVLWELQGYSKQSLRKLKDMAVLKSTNLLGSNNSHQV